jgi:hypothetical protein
MTTVFLQYPKVNNSTPGDSPYADARNHCVRYGYYSGGGRVTSVHECTHGINSQLRNHPILRADITLNGHWEDNRWVLDDPARPCNAPLPAVERAPRATAGFYLLQDRAVMLTNPIGTIQEAARLVPTSARYGRYQLYMVKQAASWGNEPLYIFDEWVAYRNGAKCLIWDAEHGGTPEGNTDFIFGPLEFCTYGIAVAMMAHDKGDLSEPVASFTRWMLTDCFNIYFTGKKYAPWQTADKLYDQFKNSRDFAVMRLFCATQLAWTVPDGVVDPNKPDNVLL